jgi:selenide,water dikinase
MREVVLVGGGHSHIQVLESLAKEPFPDARLTVVVDQPIAVYSGMVPGFIAGQYRAEELEIDVALWARRTGAQLNLTRATRIDPDKREIGVEDGPPVSYDIASFDIGSTVAGLDIPGVREHTLPTRPIGVFNQRIQEVIDAGRRHEAGAPFRIAVVGGGAGGVEVAFTLEHRLGRETKGRGQVEVTLLEGGPQILRGYSPSLVRRVHRHAKRRGIEIRCNQRVAGVERDAVELVDGQRIPCDALLWVTGAVSHSIFRDSGLPTDDRGFARVRSTLQFEQHDNVLAAGDCATLIDYPTTAKAGVYAVRQGPFITENIHALLAGTPLRPYNPQSDFLALMNLGGGIAVGTKWGISVEGRWVMTLKDRIDRQFMGRFQETGIVSPGA